MQNYVIGDHMKLNIGQPAPNFSLPATGEQTITLKDYLGKNIVLAFFPRAWTPVCSHQIPALNADLDTFTQMNTQVFALSIDHLPSLKAWLESLGGIRFPILSDFWPHGEVAQKYGVLRSEGYSERAVFIIDREGIIRYIDVHDIEDQPDNIDILKVIQQIDPETAAAHPINFDQFEEPIPQGGIVMYMTQWCEDSKRARAWLDDHHLEYHMVDINKNPSTKAKLREWSGGFITTPTFDINGTIVVDFDEEKLTKILKI